jgi:uncharacterized BrkB/YihY/UPF0761 family membrane protein
MPFGLGSIEKPPSKGLRTWLILLTVVVILVALLGVIIGVLINMDTKIEMNPNGDPLVRQDAIEFRLFAWGSIALFLLLLTAGLVGGWIAYRRRRHRTSFLLSLLTAVPVLLVTAGFLFLALRGQP